MSPKINVPYLWIRPLCLVYLNLAYGLQEIIMDLLYIPVIKLHLSFVAKTSYCNDNKITEFEIIDSENSSTAYVILYELIDLWVLDSNRRVGVWSLPWRLHILSILYRQQVEE